MESWADMLLVGREELVSVTLEALVGVPEAASKDDCRVSTIAIGWHVVTGEALGEEPAIEVLGAEDPGVVGCRGPGVLDLCRG